MVRKRRTPGTEEHEKGSETDHPNETRGGKKKNWGKSSRSGEGKDNGGGLATSESRRGGQIMKRRQKGTRDEGRFTQKEDPGGTLTNNHTIKRGGKFKTNELRRRGKEGEEKEVALKWKNNQRSKQRGKSIEKEVEKPP